MYMKIANIIVLGQIQVGLSINQTQWWKALFIYVLHGLAADGACATHTMDSQSC